MAEYHFDDLAKKAGIENSAPSAGQCYLVKEQAEEDQQN